MNASRLSSPARTALVAATLALAAAAHAQVRVDVTTLVSDDAVAHPGKITDAGLVNAWGLSYSPTSPFWVSSNGTDTATLYAVNPATQATTKNALVVSTPVGGVTGQVFNCAGAGSFNGDNFLFVGEGGAIAGWRGGLGTTAETLKPASPADVYKGAAFATLAGTGYLYAANFRAGGIDVLKGNAAAPDVTGKFLDPNLPSGYAPFNIQNLGGTLYVTYALQDAAKHDELAGAGRGFVDSFDPQGNLLGRVASAGTLDAPWGLALAPTSFGALAGAPGRQFRRRPDQRVRRDEPRLPRPARGRRRHAARDRWPVGARAGQQRQRRQQRAALLHRRARRGVARHLRRPLAAGRGRGAGAVDDAPAAAGAGGASARSRGAGAAARSRLLSRCQSSISFGSHA